MSVTIFDELVGKKFKRVMCRGTSELVFEREDGCSFRFLHYQCCCETVKIESIEGDLGDLEGSIILKAEQIDDGQAPPLYGTDYDSYTWSFYKFATAKGSVTVRWYGSSNGYYSETVDFEEIK